jgi:hypothetical protein
MPGRDAGPRCRAAMPGRDAGPRCRAASGGAACGRCGQRMVAVSRCREISAGGPQVGLPPGPLSSPISRHATARPRAQPRARRRVAGSGVRGRPVGRVEGVVGAVREQDPRRGEVTCRVPGAEGTEVDHAAQGAVCCQDVGRVQVGVDPHVRVRPCGCGDRVVPDGVGGVHVGISPREAAAARFVANLSVWWASGPPRSWLVGAPSEAGRCRAVRKPASDVAASAARVTGGAGVGTQVCSLCRLSARRWIAGRGCAWPGGGGGRGCLRLSMGVRVPETFAHLRSRSGRAPGPGAKGFSDRVSSTATVPASMAARAGRRRQRQLRPGRGGLDLRGAVAR